MRIIMNDSHLVSLAQLKEFLKVARQVKFLAHQRKEKYQWVNEILNRFGYLRLKKKKQRGVVRKYIRAMTGLSNSQLTRLIEKKKQTGRVLLSIDWGKKHAFHVVYSPTDIQLLAETDVAHNCLSGKATKRLFQRMYEIFKDLRFENLKNISISHIYNLRQTRQYRSKAKIFKPTPTIKSSIGVRRKPNPEGKPGYLRVDSVHQGDLNLGYGQYLKGVYHINLVDEVTQWEIVGCVEGISEKFLAPLLEECLKQFSFKLLNFHSDNGSEYINQNVTDILNRLIIKQTKSRPRHSNDNGLAENKNGWVVRKWMGYSHIAKEHAGRIDEFYRKYFNPYLDFHRPCGFAETTIDAKGKEVKKYKIYLTPYEKLKTLKDWTQYLTPGTTEKQLDDISLAYSDNDMARIVQQEKLKLFRTFKH